MINVNCDDFALCEYVICVTVSMCKYECMQRRICVEHEICEYLLK